MKRRWIGLSLLICATVVLCVRNVYHHPWTSLDECLSHPEHYDGHWVDQFSEPLIGKIHADGFDLFQKKGPPIRVVCDTTGLIQGEFVGIRAVFHREGYLDQAALQVAKKRREKIWVSILPALLICGMFWMYFKLNVENRCIELRHDA